MQRIACHEEILHSVAIYPTSATLTVHPGQVWPPAEQLQGSSQKIGVVVKTGVISCNI